MCAERKGIKLPHHEKQDVCLSRPPYRQGKKFTAVKVYTVNDESQHLLVFGVPKIKLRDELHRLASKFGIVKSLTLLENYPQEDEDKFTDIFHLHYRRIQAARFAKRQLDDRCFFGAVLHVCYAPELETVAETRVKLVQRRREVTARIEANKKFAASDHSTKTTAAKLRIFQRSRKHPALPLSQPRSDIFENNEAYSGNITSTAAEIQPDTVNTTSYQMMYSTTYQTLPEMGGLNQTCSTSSYNEQDLLQRQTQPQYIDNRYSAGSLQSPSLCDNSRTSHKSNDIVSDTHRQLSDEHIKSLHFVPRSITINKIHSVSTNKKKIVFYNK